MNFHKVGLKSVALPDMMNFPCSRFPSKERHWKPVSGYCAILTMRAYMRLRSRSDTKRRERAVRYLTLSYELRREKVWAAANRARTQDLYFLSSERTPTKIFAANITQKIHVNQYPKFLYFLPLNRNTGNRKQNSKMSSYLL